MPEIPSKYMEIYIDLLFYDNDDDDVNDDVDADDDDD